MKKKTPPPSIKTYGSSFSYDDSSPIIVIDDLGVLSDGPALTRLRIKATIVFADGTRKTLDLVADGDFKQYLTDLIIRQAAKEKIPIAIGDIK
jgi:hypothetical protein